MEDIMSTSSKNAPDTSNPFGIPATTPVAAPQANDDILSMFGAPTNPAPAPMANDPFASASTGAGTGAGADPLAAASNPFGSFSMPTAVDPFASVGGNSILDF
jgi:hypothetical protein